MSFEVLRNQQLKNWLVIFLIWPFGAFLGSLRQYKSPQTKLIFWLFCVYVGFSFVFPDTSGISADSARYALRLKELHNNPVPFREYLSLLYNTDSGYVDIYEPLLRWFVAFFTANPRYLFALYAAIFGYFYMQNIWMVLDKVNVKIGFVLFLFILAFALVNPIFNINGVRMWTAAQIFIYGCLRYFLYDDKKGLVWCTSTFLVHFSFLFPIALLFIYLFLPKSIVVFFVFYCITFFISEIELLQVRQTLAFLPGFFQERILIYTQDVSNIEVTPQKQEMALHLKFAFLFWRWIINFWVLLIFVYRKKWLSDIPKSKILFNLALFFGGCAQIASLVPSGGRFLILSNNLFFATFLMVIASYRLDKKIKTYGLITSPFLLFVCIVFIRGPLDYFGAFLILGNPLTTFFVEDKIPFIDFIKNLL